MVYVFVYAVLAVLFPICFLLVDLLKSLKVSIFSLSFSKAKIIAETSY